jgi:hypothetical protein
LTPGTALTASWASATIRKAKFGAQKYVGSRRCTSATPSTDPWHDATNPSVVTGSSSSGSRTVSSADSTSTTGIAIAVTSAPPFQHSDAT